MKIDPTLRRCKLHPFLRVSFCVAVRGKLTTKMGGALAVKSLHPRLSRKIYREVAYCVSLCIFFVVPV